MENTLTQQYLHRIISKHRKEIFDILDRNKTAIVFDTETTGLPGKNGLTESTVEIIQFSAMLISISDEGKISELEKFNIYVRPKNELSEEVSELTGITQDILNTAPYEGEAVDIILRFMNKAKLWIGYNVPFDIARFKWMCMRTGRDDQWTKLNPNTKSGVDVIDVLPMVRNFVNDKAIESYKKKNGIKKRGTYKLEFVMPLLRNDIELQFHDSMEDVRATALVLEALLPVYKAYNVSFGQERPNISMVRFNVNPHQVRNSRKICLYTPSKEKDGSIGERYPVFWDISKAAWTCKSDAKSKKIFSQVDLEYLEETALNLAISALQYIPGEFETPNMDSLAIQLEKAYMNTWQGKQIQDKSKEINKARKKEEERASAFV